MRCECLFHNNNIFNRTAKSFDKNQKGINRLLVTSTFPKVSLYVFLFIFQSRVMALQRIIVTSFAIAHSRCWKQSHRTQMLMKASKESLSNGKSRIATGSASSSNSKDNKHDVNSTRVAIIGGGMAGLSCAQRLTSSNTKYNINQKQHSFQVTVYDTGRLRVGGRCSSRLPGDPSFHEETNSQQSTTTTTANQSILTKYRYDHAAQVISVSMVDDPQFAQQVQEWERSGIVKEYPPDSIFHIVSGRSIRPIKQSETTKLYYAIHGMGSIPESMADTDQFEIQRNVWVSPSNGVRHDNQTRQWSVQAKGKVLGKYDAIVIAHNGKCADRLMSTTPAVDVHSKLRVSFAPTIPTSTQRMTLNSIYSLTFATLSLSAKYKHIIPKSFIFGYVSNNPSIRSITCQTRKFPKSNSTSNKDNSIELWTILSSPQFAKQYKAPQEFIPPETIRTVTNLLLLAFEETLGFKSTPNNNHNNTTEDLAVPETNGMHASRNNKDAKTNNERRSCIFILDQRLQLWGAGVPLNVWCSQSSNSSSILSITSSSNPSSTTTKKTLQPAGFIYDGRYNVGVCGDWLVEPSIAGAWNSGQLLAEYMINHRQHQNEDSTGSATSSNSNRRTSSSHGLEGIFRKSDLVAKRGIGSLR